MKLYDNGYISNYLIHWAGKSKSPNERASVLSQIATTCQLLLSKNDFFFDGSLKVIDKMVCFTDVPLGYSKLHCERYSNFGIAFHKLRLMNKGAQPVFYFSHIFRNDMGKIYRFVLDQIQNRSLEPEIFQALHRHFYFMQEFSQGRPDRNDTSYYEREWRIGELCLRPEGENKGRWSLNNNLPTSIGTLITEGNITYFQFEKADVAFLIAPSQFITEISNPYKFEIKTYEKLVENGGPSD